MGSASDATAIVPSGLASDTDAWYLGTKKAFRRDKTGKSGDDIGTEVGCWARCSVNKRLDLGAGIAHFFPGQFADKTGPSDGMDFCYFQANFKF